MKLFIKHARDKTTFYRAVKVGLVVGTILALINHYHAIFTGNLDATIVFQIFLTYLVPFGVATYGSAGHARHLELKSRRTKDPNPIKHNK